MAAPGAGRLGCCRVGRVLEVPPSWGRQVAWWDFAEPRPTLRRPARREPHPREAGSRPSKCVTERAGPMHPDLPSLLVFAAVTLGVTAGCRLVGPLLFREARQTRARLDRGIRKESDGQVNLFPNADQLTLGPSLSGSYDRPDREASLRARVTPTRGARLEALVRDAGLPMTVRQFLAAAAGVGVLVRDRLRIRKQVRTLTAEGRLQGTTLLVLPFLVFGVLMAINRKYAEVLLDHPSLLLATGAVMVVGVLWIRKIIDFDI